jgi:hypothetical protein
MFGVLADIQAEAIQTPSNHVYSPGSAPDAFVERELYPLKNKPTPYCPYVSPFCFGFHTAYRVSPWLL